MSCIERFTSSGELAIPPTIYDSQPHEILLLISFFSSIPTSTIYSSAAAINVTPYLQQGGRISRHISPFSCLFGKCSKLMDHLRYTDY